MERTLISHSANLVLSLDTTTVLFHIVLSSFSHVQLFATPWTVAHQAPLSMGFSRQEYCGALPCSAPGDLLNSGIEPPCFSCFARRVLNTRATWEAPSY